MSDANSFDELVARLTAMGFLVGCDEILKKRQTAVDIILGMPSERPSSNLSREIFIRDYEPGTFAISERKTNPLFIGVDDQSAFEKWVFDEAESDLERLLPCLQRVCPWQLPPGRKIETIPGKVLDCLEFEINGTTLAEHIYQQEYTDIFRRIHLIYLTGWPLMPFNEYDGINNHLLEIGLELAERCAALDTDMLLRFTAAAGLAALNHKRNASATAILYNKSIIPIDFEDPLPHIIDTTFPALLEKAQEGWKIDNENLFFKMLSSKRTQVMTFFTDDFLEGILDLKLMERLLEEHPGLQITVVPRAIRFGNDMGFADIINLLNKEIFQDLKNFFEKGRLKVEPMGPLSGTVNGLRLSRDVLTRIKSSDILFFKGARSYECSQGINRNCFFAFSVCRNISESVTGIDAETGGLVLVYQEPGKKSFCGFRQRHLRPLVLPSGRKAWLAEKTALDAIRKSEL